MGKDSGYLQLTLPSTQNSEQFAHLEWLMMENRFENASFRIQKCRFQKSTYLVLLRNMGLRVKDTNKVMESIICEQSVSHKDKENQEAHDD